MIATDEDALMCDLAEVYHIYNMRSFSPLEIAAFSVGLRENSRIKLKINGMRYPLETILLAQAVDRLSLLIWAKTKDAEHGRNRPESIAEKLLEVDKRQDREYMVYDSPEAFEQAMRNINREEE